MTTTPHLDAYIASLPAGLSSYPELSQKSIVAHSLLEAWPDAALATPHLPEALQRFVADLPPRNVWVSEVMGMALWVAAIDLAGGGTFAGFRPISVRANRALMGNPLYSLVFRAIGGRLTVRAAAVAWTTFHRGVEQELELDNTTATITLRFPVGVFPAVLAPSFAVAYQVGLEVGGVKNVQHEVLRATSTEIRYRLNW